MSLKEDFQTHASTSLFLHQSARLCSTDYSVYIIGLHLDLIIIYYSIKCSVDCSAMLATEERRYQTLV